MMEMMMLFRYLGRDQRMTPPESPRESAHNISSQVVMVILVFVVVVMVMVMLVIIMVVFFIVVMFMVLVTTLKVNMVVMTYPR